MRDAAYDLVFVDADKSAYAVYYEQAVRMLRPGGVVAFDNMLWHDRVADPSQRDPDTVVLRELARTVRDDERLVSALLAGRRRAAGRRQALTTGVVPHRPHDRTSTWPATSTRCAPTPTPGCASPSSATCWPTPARSCTTMADALGIPRRFFQDHPWRWHHDLPAHLRARAVALGAREVTMHEVGALLRARKRGAERRDRAPR